MGPDDRHVQTLGHGRKHRGVLLDRTAYPRVYRTLAAILADAAAAEDCAQDAFGRQLNSDFRLCERPTFLVP
ncbi:MAG: hypothetical protein E6H82_14615 [Chloroflexi bacterium]|nr:MAG: hypothetical protein E6H82_14615 [Chloroflexota bacterium]